MSEAGRMVPDDGASSRNGEITLDDATRESRMLDGEVVQEQEQEQEKAKDKDDQKEREAQIQMMAQLDLDRGNTNPWAVADLASRTHLTTETGAFYPLAQFKLSPTITTFPFPLGLMVSENHSHSLFRWVGLSSFWFC